MSNNNFYEIFLPNGELRRVHLKDGVPDWLSIPSGFIHDEGSKRFTATSDAEKANDGASLELDWVDHRAAKHGLERIAHELDGRIADEFST